MNVSNLQESKIVTRYEMQPNPARSNLNSPQPPASLNFSNSNIRNTQYQNQNMPVSNYMSSMSSGNYMSPSPNYVSPGQNNMNPGPNIVYSQNNNPIPGFYDPKFMGVNWETEQTQNSEVRIARSCWLGYHRNNYHPSMTQYRISYDEFNDMVDKIEAVSSGFKWIQVIYILMVLVAMFSIMLFIIGLFLEPGESITNVTVFEDLNSASTGLIVSGLLIFIIGGLVLALIIWTRLKKYEFIIRRMLQNENQHTYYSRSINWLISPLCTHIEIKCLPVTAQQYYMMLQQTNQLKISKEHLEKLKKENPK